jgi:hypothetical protein
MIQQTIGQIIIDHSSLNRLILENNTITNNLLSGAENVISLSIYGLPGCAIYLDRTNTSTNKIIIGHTGLF